MRENNKEWMRYVSDGVQLVAIVAFLWAAAHLIGESIDPENGGMPPDPAHPHG